MGIFSATLQKKLSLQFWWGQLLWILFCSECEWKPGEANDIALVAEVFCNNNTNIAVCFAGSKKAGNEDDYVNDACSSKSKL